MKHIGKPHLHLIIWRRVAVPIQSCFWQRCAEGPVTEQAMTLALEISVFTHECICMASCVALFGDAAGRCSHADGSSGVVTNALACRIPLAPPAACKWRAAARV